MRVVLSGRNPIENAFPRALGDVREPIGKCRFVGEPDGRMWMRNVDERLVT